MYRGSLTIQRTPHPRTVKFIVERDVLEEGAATFTRDLVPPQYGPMVAALVVREGVERVRLEGKVITVTFTADADKNRLIDELRALIVELLPLHRSGAVPAEETPHRRLPENRPEKVVHLQNVLDQTVGPYIASHGGDVVVLNYEEKANLVMIDFNGACGGCGGSGGSTLQALEGVFREELGDDVTVAVANPFEEMW